MSRRDLPTESDALKTEIDGSHLSDDSEQHRERRVSAEPRDSSKRSAPRAHEKKKCHCTCREYAYVYVGAIESRAGVVFLVLF